jgi:hypothetical protein
MRLSMSWPKLLGSVLLLEAAGIILLQASFWSVQSPSGFPSVTASSWCELAVTILFSFVSYAVYRGHNWARLTVIFLGIGWILFFTYSRIAATIHAWYQFDPYGGRYPFRIWQVLADDVGSLLVMFVAPLAFVICTLCHRDVAATFGRQAPETI